MKTTIVQNNKVQTLKNCRALAFTGHTNKINGFRDSYLFEIAESLIRFNIEFKDLI